VKLFSLVVEQNPPVLVLLRSLFVNLLDVAESVFPVLTPETLVDSQPLMQPVVLTEQPTGLPKKGDLK
jgi:nitrous oxidase accessory protein